MKKAVFMLMTALAAFLAIAKPVSTQWNQTSQKYPHGIGHICPHCGQVWGKIPKGLKPWEVRHLKREFKKLYALHLKIRHGIKEG